MKKSVPAEMMAQNSSEGSLRVAAYYIWQKEGCPHGRDLEHWYQASAELARPPKPTKTALPKKSTPLRAVKKQNYAAHKKTRLE